MKNRIKFLALIIIMGLGIPKTFAQVSLGISISANIAPPPLPVYVQPDCPVDGYLWVPGYWAYDPDGGYYWVPGVWVAPPQPGYLWTPGYWGYEGGSYGFHHGYWGTHVGFYGGVNYGGGYLGIGFAGGEWHGGSFRYNTAVMHVNTTVVHNTYVNTTIVHNTTIVNNHTSFNGPGGVSARPRPEDRIAMNEHHIMATPQQQTHVQAAHSDKSLFANVNHGQPTRAAMNTVGGRSFTPTGHPAPANHGGFGNNANRPQGQGQPGQSHAQGQPQQPANHTQMSGPPARQQAAPQQMPQQQRQQQQQQMQNQQHQQQMQRPQPQQQPRPQPQQQRPQPQQQRPQPHSQPQGHPGGERERHP
jgi:hypothetical protein